MEIRRTVVEVQKRNHDGLGHAAVYIISPVDVVPDVLPILGWLDDGVVLILLFKLAFKLLPKEIYESLKAQFEKKAASSMMPLLQSKILRKQKPTMWSM